MKQEQQYTVILAPKRGFREAYKSYVAVVLASSAKEAIAKVPHTWPIGEGSYTKPIVSPVDRGAIAF